MVPQLVDLNRERTHRVHVATVKEAKELAARASKHWAAA